MKALSSKNKSSPQLSLSVQYACPQDGVPTRHQFRRWFKRALQCDAKITLRIVDEMEGRELNRNFRNKDYATNVLTFVYDDFEMLSADVVMCVPVVASEAVAQHKQLAAHYAHLTIHAALHLQGYDHQHNAEAEKMEALEAALMLELRYPNPY
jgi:probable rRNA maturation factor